MSNRQMLINYVAGEECRIAIMEDGRLEELYQERASSESHVGNIYQGRVVSVEPSIQAAFVDFGLERNGFLHVSDLHPMYFGGESQEDTERVGSRTPRRDRPPIQSCLRRGQDILVQVIKDGISTKGPTLTSYLSIPGRFLVMMPYMERLGVSRKVEDDEARHQMRKALNELNPPKDFGFIIRTAGIGRTKADLKRDLAYLQRLWKTIEQRRQKSKQPGELYTESDLVIRTIRDLYSTDIDRIIIDDPSAARRVQSFLLIASPRSAVKVDVYEEVVPLFYRYGLERQIDTIHARTAPLPSGGSLVIDSAEALVAIDVNSGKNRDNRDAEMTAYKTNLEAVDEICRQLRLRDLGGVVVIDLIDMRRIKYCRDIEQRFRNNLKRDRARTHVLPISRFGILEMTRQRMKPSLKRSIYKDCPNCQGAGLVKTPESVVLDVMRRLARVLHQQQVVRVELTISPDVAFHLLNRKRSQLVAIEQRLGKAVTVRVGGNTLDYVHLAAFDARGGTADIEAATPSGPPQLIPVQELPKQVKAEVDQSTDESELTDSQAVSQESKPTPESDSDPEQDSKPRPRRRRRRGGRGRGQKTGTGDSGENQTSDNPDTPKPIEASDADTTQQVDADQAPAVGDPTADQEPPSSKPRRRRRRSSRSKSDSTADQSSQATNNNADEKPTNRPPRRQQPPQRVQNKTDLPPKNESGQPVKTLKPVVSKESAAPKRQPPQRSRPKPKQPDVSPAKPSRGYQNTVVAQPAKVVKSDP